MKSSKLLGKTEVKLGSKDPITTYAGTTSLCKVVLAKHEGRMPTNDTK